MPNERPTLNDPKEYALIKKIYFEDDNILERNDPTEELERMESRQRNTNNNSR